MLTNMNEMYRNKRMADIIPQFNLKIEVLREALSEEEFNLLIQRYMTAKKNRWSVVYDKRNGN